MSSLEEWFHSRWRVLIRLEVFSRCLKTGKIFMSLPRWPEIKVHRYFSKMSVEVHKIFLIFLLPKLYRLLCKTTTQPSEGRNQSFIIQLHNSWVSRLQWPKGSSTKIKWKEQLLQVFVEFQSRIYWPEAKFKCQYLTSKVELYSRSYIKV